MFSFYRERICYLLSADPIFMNGVHTESYNWIPGSKEGQGSQNRPVDSGRITGRH